MNIGLFFGSFNPVHIGHLAIANYMLEFTDLDKIWFVISPQNPLKEKNSLLPDYHRFEMVNLAIGDNSKMKASNIESKLPKPSFTVTTLTYLKEKYPDQHFVLIMGSDNLLTFHKWRNFEAIIQDHELYVYPRLKCDGVPQFNLEKVKYIKAPIMEISSSFIRQAIKEKKNIRYFLHEKVYDFIMDMHFYTK